MATCKNVLLLMHLIFFGVVCVCSLSESSSSCPPPVLVFRLGTKFKVKGQIDLSTSRIQMPKPTEDKSSVKFSLCCTKGRYDITASGECV